MVNPSVSASPLNASVTFTPSIFYPFNTNSSTSSFTSNFVGSWQAVLDYRGDYDDFNWPIETDTSQFPELIEELYSQL